MSFQCNKGSNSSFLKLVMMMMMMNMIMSDYNDGIDDYDIDN